jgi:hypothetical protein
VLSVFKEFLLTFVSILALSISGIVLIRHSGLSSIHVERGTFRRVTVERPCIVRRHTPTPLLLEGVTRNLGRSGAVLSIAGTAVTSFSAGNQVTVEIILDANARFGQRCICGRGIVSRVEQDPTGAAELAVDFESVMFRPVSVPWLNQVNSQIT